MKEKTSAYNLEERHIPFGHQEYISEKQFSRERQESALFGQDILEKYDELRDQVERNLKLADEATTISIINKRVVFKNGEEIPVVEYYLGLVEEARTEIRELNSRNLFQRLQEEFSVLLEALEEKPEYSFRKNKENKKRREITLKIVGNLLRPLVNINKRMSLEEIEDIFKNINDGNCSNTELLKILKKHRESIVAKEKILNEKVEIYKKEFKSRVKSMVTRGELPQEALTHLGNIDIAKPNLIDYLSELTSGKIGEAKKCDGLLISSILLKGAYESELKQTVYHEFVHILSGKGINLYSSANENELLLKMFTGSSKRSKRIKRGLLFQSYKYDSSKFRNYSLNEATTELLTLLILGDNNWDDNQDGRFQGSQAYVEERSKLDTLIKKGLNMQILFKAYFENVTSEQAVSERFKYTRRLIQEMDAIDQGVYLRWNNEGKMSLIESQLAKDNIFTKDTIPRDNSLLENKVILGIFFVLGKTQYSEVKQLFLYIPSGEEISEEEARVVGEVFKRVQEQIGGRIVGAKDIDLRDGK